MRTRAKAADIGSLDIPYLAIAFDLSEQDIQSLLDAPTTEGLQNLLLTFTDKGKEFEALKAEKLKADVQLETQVRNSENKIRAQKAVAENHTKDIHDLQIKLNESEAARESITTELSSLKSSATSSTAETQTLIDRIENLEASNRDALALVESKSTEKDRLATELSEQHSKLLGLRRQLSELEDKTQSLDNAATSQKFREQSLQQEIDQLRRNLEWHQNELKTQTTEHTKFRKDRNEKFSRIQRELEDSNATVDTLKRTETTLRQRLDEVQSKHDEVLTRIASLEEDAIRKQQDFRTELDSSRRLAELQAQSAATHKERLHEVQQHVEQIKEDAADEIGRLQAEVETERSDKEEAEAKVAELELAVERLENQSVRMSRPGTPMRNGNGDPTTPRRPGSVLDSPLAMPGSLRKNLNGLTFSQLYAKFSESQEELEAERRRTDKLSVAMDELINEMESRKPEVEESRAEQERLEAQVLEFSALLDEANETRDASTRNAATWQGEAQASAREGTILRQQLRDLSAQVKILLVELSSRDQGIGEMSADERFELERAARGEVGEDSLAEMTNTGRLISERLVLFRDATELVERNEQLLRLTRELGDRMEGEEAVAKARQSAADAEEVEELRQQVERYRDELQSTATQIDSYMKERDLFRRMLQHRGQLPHDADLQSMFGQSIMPATPMRGGMEPPATPRSREMDDLNKILKEQQVFFDQFREESQSDRRMLKDQVDALGREKSSIQADLARAQSQLTIAASRYETLQANYTSLQNENQQLQKRSQQHSDNALEQDRRVAKLAEELVEAQATISSVRHENSNARAERDIFKRSEARLNEDNEHLREERTRLNKLVTDLQNLQNERELTDADTRRRLQSRVEALDTELGETKKRLDVQIEENRKSSLRREFEEGQNRSRIDDLVKSLGNVREELVAAKTTRDQLQARVDEMKIDLRAAEEKATALQPRPTPRVEPAQTQQQTVGAEDDALPAEQRLAVEISELRRDLEYAKSDLESAKQQVEVYKGISQASEEELANFSTTADQYKEETENLIAEKDAKIKELEQRIEDLSSELTTTNSELSELRTSVEDTSRLLSQQKATYESEVTRLRDDAERYVEEKKLYQEDLKAQAAIAQQAQQSYEDELVKHADAARSLQTVRKEYGELKQEVNTVKAAAEAAKISLERGEESWTEQRDRYEIELEEIRRRRQDVDEQNKLLHKQMDAFSNELAALRQGRAAVAASVTGETTEASTETSSNNYQEVIKYLRREKEIVDVQYELSLQEGKRLQQQLTYVEGQLEETKQKLVDERRQVAEKASAEGSTSRLMQTINELNLYRESSITLRAEAKAAREKLEEKAVEVERLIAEAEPLKERVDVLEADVEAKDGEMKLLQSDRDHWRERTQNIISKYDRVDPAELEEMKTQLESLKTEKQELESAQGPLQDQVTSLQAELNEKVTTLQAQLENAQTSAAQNLNERLEKFKGQAKEQDRKRQAQIRDLTSEKETITSELEKAKADLLAATDELEQTKSALEQSREEAAKAQASNEDAEEGQVDESSTAEQNDNGLTAAQARADAAEAMSQEHEQRANTLAIEVQTLNSRVQDLESQAATLQQQLQNAGSSDGSEPQLTSIDNAETLEKLRQDLATAQQEVETLRANTAAPPVPATSAQSPITSDDPAASTEQSAATKIAEEVAKLKAQMEAQHELAKKQMEENVNMRIEKMKENLRRQLVSERQKYKDSIADEHAAEIKKIQDEHDAAIAQLKEIHQAELARLASDGDKAIAKAETMTPVKASDLASVAGDGKAPELTEAQVKDLIKTNASAKSIITANIRSNVDKQTEKLTGIIAARDAEIAQLKSKLEQLPAGESAVASADGTTVTRAELEAQLEAAKVEKEAAVRQAVENGEKKAKVQVSQRDMAQAKLAVVRKAATETPDRPVKEVWEIADKTRPAPKPAAAAAAAPAASVASTPAANTVNTLSTSSPNPRAPEFKPVSSDAPSESSTVPTATTTTTAASAATASQPAVRTGIPLPGARGGRGGIPASGLPRIPQRAPSGAGMQIQGAAAAQGQPGGAAQRGGIASGLPRGGRGGARGGRGGANAGTKRQHEGADGNDTGKRMRGGGGPDGGAA